jgi:hypothetical protein
MDRFLLEVNPVTKDRLDRMKEYPEEPYDLVLNRLIDSFEDIEAIKEALRDLKEGRFVAPGQVKEQPVPAPETPLHPAGDPQAVKDMEKIFSGTMKIGQDTELTNPEPGDTDPGDIHELTGFDTRGRSRTPRLDSL